MIEKVFIKNNKSLNIAAYLECPDKDKKYPLMVLLHGFTGYKDEEHIAVLASELSKNGCASIRFDCSGFGESEGTTEIDYRVSNFYSDINSVFSYVKTLDCIDSDRLAIWGNSLGGTIAICFASENPWIKALCTVSAPIEFARKDNFERRTKAWKETGYFDKESSRYGHIRIPYAFVEDSKKWNALDCVKNIKVPSLYVVGQADQNVYPESTKKIFEYANEPKQLIEIEGMDHFYKKESTFINQVNEVILKFLKEYLF